jgi:lysophospholipase L1-like esterase
VVLALGAVPASAQTSGSYVGLGDSYAAGPLIPAQLEPYGCLKSSNNYAQLAAKTLVPAAFRDVSCSGGKTNHMTQPQGVTPGPNPPQFGALDAGTTLVTLQVGGNDIGFSGIAEDCFSTNPNGSVCEPKYVVNGVDEVSARIAATAPKVAAVIQGIHERSPSARVLVVNYAAIFPHSGGGCWPQLPVANGDVAWLRSKQVELNQMIADQAAANGARLVDAYSASVGRDACKLPVLRWIEPLVPVGPAAPVHPNVTGMLGISKLVVAAAR